MCLRYDIAWRTLRRPGVPRFSAVCILSESLWLAVGGALALAAGAVYAGPLYDALLHSLFVGFVFAMIFGHAPIIVPALLRLPLSISRWSHLPLAACTSRSPCAWPATWRASPRCGAGAACSTRSPSCSSPR